MTSPTSEGARQPRRLTSVLALLPPLLYAVAAIAALAAGLWYASVELNKSYENLESERTDQQAAQIYRALEADLRQLAISARDYAVWDEAETFITKGDGAFLDSNFGYETLLGMQVDFVILARPTGGPIFTGQLDRERQQVVRTMAPGILEALRPVLARADELWRLRPNERLVRTPLGLTAIAAYGIRRTDYTAPTGVYLLFGRVLGGSEIGRARQISQLPIHFLDLGEHSITDRLTPGVLGWAQNGELADDTYVQPINNERIEGYARLKDLHGTTQALLMTYDDRDITAAGRHTTLSLLLAIAVLLCCFAALMLVIAWRFKRVFEKSRAADYRYQAIANQLHEFLVMVDAQSGDIVDLNAAVERRLGYSAEQLKAVGLRGLAPDLSFESIADLMPEPGKALVRESRLRLRDGTFLDAEISVTYVADRASKILCLTCRDVSHRRRAEQQRREGQRRLVHLAQHDALTQLPNRLYLQTRLPKVLKKVVEREHLLGLLFMDVDHFKGINDSLGHESGDLLLQTVATRLRAAVAPQDVVVRMGGDEFVIVAPLIHRREELDRLAQHIQTALCAPIVVKGQELNVSASIGIAVYPEDGLEMEMLLKHADIALYEAKEAGRHRHEFFTPTMNVRVSENVALEQALRHALGTDQIYVDYQPVIDLTTGALRSFEALARWRHPELGAIPPAQFIPVAEKSGLIVELGEEILRRVVAQLHAWRDADIQLVPIAVNVSALQLQRIDFPALARSVAGTHGIELSMLRFEITESALLKDPEKLIGTLQTLRDAGAKILIDDFGTGYSGLSYLSRLPVDVVKIDRSFVRDLNQGASKDSIAAAVIDLARELRLDTIAEGVEDAEQHRLLLELGCNFGQGYYYSRPISARQCRALLRSLREHGRLTTTLVQKIAGAA